MRKDTINFLASAEYDIGTAEHMFETGRYVYVVFMCHLAIEKMLKAIAAEVTGVTPPKTHNLLYLTKLAKVDFEANHFEFVSKISNASIVTRYPEDFERILLSYPAEVARTYLTLTKEVIGWLKQNEKLRK